MKKLNCSETISAILRIQLELNKLDRSMLINDENEVKVLSALTSAKSDVDIIYKELTSKIKSIKEMIELDMEEYEVK